MTIRFTSCLLTCDEANFKDDKNVDIGDPANIKMILIRNSCNI